MNQCTNRLIRHSERAALAWKILTYPSNYTEAEIIRSKAVLQVHRRLLIRLAKEEPKIFDFEEIHLGMLHLEPSIKMYDGFGRDNSKN